MQTTYAEPATGLPPESTCVANAIDIVAVQARCTGSEAYALLMGRALIFDQEVELLSESVVNGGMRFGPLAASPLYL